MKDLGELCYFLGIEIVHMKEGIWLSKRQYALDMLSKYGMANCKPTYFHATRLEFEVEG